MQQQNPAVWTESVISQHLRHNGVSHPSEDRSFFYNLKIFVKKLLAVSKSLLYSTLQYCGVFILVVGFQITKESIVQ
jgi:hypothetical protein